MMTRNPFYKKIEKAKNDEERVSYSGIAIKCLWYWILCAAGIAAYYFVPIQNIPIPVLIAGACVAIVCPILTYFVPTAAAIFGSLYSVVMGFAIAAICNVYAASYVDLVYIAVAITVLVFIIVLLLYRTGLIKVGHKFKAIFLTLFFASVLASGGVYISSFFTDTLTNLFWGDGGLAIVVAAVSLLFAVINLVMEFDFATKLVEQGMCKRYEWTAAYGLFMSVVLIFLRTLQLLSKVLPKGGD